MWPTATVILALALGACSGGGSPTLECNTEVTPACAPLYPPTFENVYAMTLAPHCGSGARSCHSDAGMKGGMTFSTIDNAYDALLEPGQDRVLPGDPGCSIMIIRTHSTNVDVKMPPGSSLIPAERCALVQWVAEGAARSGIPVDAAPADAALPDAAIDAAVAGAAP